MKSTLGLRRNAAITPAPIPWSHLLAVVLAGSLAPGNFARATDLLHLEPARALPEYTKVSLAKGTSNEDELYPAFALGDFNEDGRLDVAIAKGARPPVTPYGVRVYLQNADGSLQMKGEFMLPNTELTWTFFSADFNNDSHLDLLLEDTGNDLILVLGNGDGMFQAPQFLGLLAPGFPVAAHFNGDLHLDLVSGALDGTVGVFAGAGDGTFVLQSTLNTLVHPSQPERSGQIVVGDLNRDGNLDVAVASVQDSQTYTGNLDVFLGNGDGTFQAMIQTPDVLAHRGTLGDFKSEA